MSAGTVAYRWRPHGTSGDARCDLANGAIGVVHGGRDPQGTTTWEAGVYDPEHPDVACGYRMIKTGFPSPLAAKRAVQAQYPRRSR